MTSRYDDDRAPLIRWEDPPFYAPHDRVAAPEIVDRTPEWAIGPTYEPSWECTCPSDCLHDHEYE